MRCKIDVYNVILYHRNTRIELNNFRSLTSKTRQLYFFKNQERYVSISVMYWTRPSKELHPLQDPSSSSNIFSWRQRDENLPTRMHNKCIWQFFSESSSSLHRVSIWWDDFRLHIEIVSFHFLKSHRLKDQLKKETRENDGKMHWWLFSCRLSNSISRWRDHRLDNCKINGPDD